MAQDNDLFRTALEGKKIPILTLDHKWHKLFTQTGDNDEIHAQNRCFTAFLDNKFTCYLLIVVTSPYKLCQICL